MLQYIYLTHLKNIILIYNLIIASIKIDILLFIVTIFLEYTKQFFFNNETFYRHIKRWKTE